MTSRTVYEYKVFPLKSVLHYTNKIFPDAYYAHDLDGKSKQDWDEALALGYRWIRTDGELVILERKCQKILGRKFLSE